MIGWALRFALGSAVGCYVSHVVPLVPEGHAPAADSGRQRAAASRTAIALEVVDERVQERIGTFEDYFVRGELLGPSDEVRSAFARPLTAALESLGLAPGSDPTEALLRVEVRALDYRLGRSSMVVHAAAKVIARRPGCEFDRMYRIEAVPHLFSLTELSPIGVSSARDRQIRETLANLVGIVARDLARFPCLGRP